METDYASLQAKFLLIYLVVHHVSSVIAVKDTFIGSLAGRSQNGLCLGSYEWPL